METFCLLDFNSLRGPRYRRSLLIMFGLFSCWQFQLPWGILIGYRNGCGFSGVLYMANFFKTKFYEIFLEKSCVYIHLLVPPAYLVMSDISRDCVGFPLFFWADECQSRPKKRSFSKSRKCKAQREKGRLNQSIGSSGFASFLRLRSRDPATFRRSKQTWGLVGLVSFSLDSTFQPSASLLLAHSDVNKTDMFRG